MCGNSNSGKPLKFKQIVQEGVNSVVNNNASSIIMYRVQCFKKILFPINRCMHCPFNRGVHPQAPTQIMQCAREKGEELPEVLNAEEDPDYPVEPEKKENQNV